MAGSETKSRVLAGVGAWPRDVLDRRFVTEMSGAISTSGEPAQRRTLASLTGTAIADADADGMGDDWEGRFGRRNPAITTIAMATATPTSRSISTIATARSWATSALILKFGIKPGRSACLRLFAGRSA